ncbi:helix-turn-helix transcriptional regulator [Nocardia sp. NPDC050710]|uniref:helix-turn-helix domain-containing protein n=1 Tax=Nocardia sp. NPDC050710 TaxID=3157220 RepID=UPI0034024C9C
MGFWQNRQARKQAQRERAARNAALSVAVGVEVALLRIAAGKRPSQIADTLRISVVRYCGIEEGGVAPSVSMAELEAIASHYGTTFNALYQAAVDRIERGDMPTHSSARVWEQAIGIPASDDDFRRLASPG